MKDHEGAVPPVARKTANPRKVPCRLIRESLLEYLTGELSAEKAWLVGEHLRHCPECSDEAARLARTLDFMRSATAARGVETALPQSARRRFARAIMHPVIDWICVHHRLVALGTALLVLACVMLAAWLCSFRPETVIYWLK